MKKLMSVAILIVTFVMVQNVKAKTFYWVKGGSTTWGLNANMGPDSTNWSLTSGGMANQGYPGPNDTAYFDNNSFDSLHNYLSMSGNLEVNSLICNKLSHTSNWNPQFNLNYQNYNNSLTLHGSLVLDSNMTQQFGSLGLIFKSDNRSNVIDLRTQSLGYSGIDFYGLGSWKLLSNFNGYANVNFHPGTSFNTNGYTFSMNGVTDSSGTFTISPYSVVNIYQTWDFSSKGAAVIMDTTSVINFQSVATGKIAKSNLYAPYGVFNGGGLVYTNVNFSNSATITGANTYDTLTINMNDSILIPNNDTQTFKYLKSLATQYSPSGISADTSNKSKVIFNNIGNNKTCLSYVSLKNIQLQGSAFFVYGGIYNNSIGFDSLKTLTVGDPYLIDSVKCKDVNAAIISLKAAASGGLSPYTYTWTNIENYSTVTTSTDTLKTAANNSNYFVSVNDACGQSIMGNSSSVLAFTKNVSDSIANPYALNLAVICNGLPDSVSIYASAANVVSYSWAPNIGYFRDHPGLNGLSDTIHVKPLATTTYTVTLSSTGRCSQTFAIPVKLENPQAKFKANTYNVCLSADSFKLDGSSSSGLVYKPYWYASNQPAPTMPKINGTVIPTQPGRIGLPDTTVVKVPINVVGQITYTLTLGGDNGCSSSASVTVNVSDSIRNFKISTLSGHDTLCYPGATATHLVAYTSTVDTALKYSWSPMTGLDVSNKDSVKALPNVTTFYTVQIRNNGCSKTDSIKITVGSPLAKLASHQLQVCQGQTILLDGSQSVGKPQISDWTFPSQLTLVSFNDTNLLKPYFKIDAAAGQYKFLLKMEDNGCWSQPDSIIVTVQDSSNHVGGKVTFNKGTQAVTKGWVYLFKDNGKHQGRWPKTDSVALDQNGNYTFLPSSLGMGNYVIGVIPDTSAYPRMTSRYFHQPKFSGDTSSVFLWGGATSFSVSCHQTDTFNLDIPLIPSVDSLNGSGIISGTILHGTDAIALKIRGILGLNTPVSGIPVGLGKRPDPGADIIEKTHTDGTGFYKFINVPPGDYVIYADIPGMPQDSAYQVTVGQKDTVIPNLNYMVNDTIIYIPAIVGTGIGKVSNSANENNLMAYPNPFSKTSKVDLLIANDQDHCTLDVFNLLGEKIATLYAGPIRSGSYTFNLDESLLPNHSGGVYFLRMQGSNYSLTKRLIHIEQ